MMDIMEARLACLAAARRDAYKFIGDAKQEAVLDVARKYAEFVIGPSVRESKNAGAPKGADETGPIAQAMKTGTQLR